MAVTYFGECNTDGSILAAEDGYDTGNGGYTLWITATCPAGTYAVKSLGFYGSRTATSGQVKVALYNSAGTTLITAGSAALDPVNSEVRGWVEHTSLTVTDASISAGTYLIAVTVDNNDVIFPYHNGSAGDLDLQAGDYTDTNFPSSISGTADAPLFYMYRVGIEAGGGATNIPVTLTDALNA